MEHPLVTETPLGQAKVALPGEVVEAPLQHARPVRLGDLDCPVRAERVDHEDVVGPRDRVEAPGEVRLLVEGEDQDGDRHASGAAWERHRVRGHHSSRGA